MILVLDIGNTRIKSAVFEGETIKNQSSFGANDLQVNIQNILNNFQNITHLIVSSVGKIEKNHFDLFSGQLTLVFITRNLIFPFHNNYSSQETLGIDRMVLAAGAVLDYPNQNRLVIDAGTCITYDFIDNKNVYHGGAISPGIKLRYESLHNFTANLPLLTISKPENVVGKSTNESIHSGVINGVTFEIDGFIDSFKLQKDKFIIILTGGDAIFLANQLKNTIFANSNFLLESLNKLYLYQIKND